MNVFLKQKIHSVIGGEAYFMKYEIAQPGVMKERASLT
jgi:hypothetical protein